MRNKILFALIIVFAVNIAFAGKIDTIPQDSVLSAVITKQDNLEKNLVLTTTRVNANTFSISVMPTPAFKADLQACLSNIGACDKNAFKNKWLQGSSLTIGDLISDLNSARNMPVRNLTKVGSLISTTPDYVNGFTVVVQFTEPNQRIQIGYHSVTIDSAIKIVINSNYITRSLNQTQLFAQAVKGTNLEIYKSLDDGSTWTAYSVDVADTDYMACSSDELNTINCLGTGFTISFNMSNVTFTAKDTTEQIAISSQLSRPLPLRNGSLITLQNGGVTMPVWASEDKGHNWTLVTTLTGDYAGLTGSSNSYGATQTDNGYIHVLIGTGAGCKYFNMTNGTYALSDIILVNATANPDISIASSGNTVYGTCFIHQDSGVQWFKKTPSSIVNTSIVLNTGNTLLGDSAGNIIIDNATDIAYFSVSNGTDNNANARSLIFHSINSGQSINATPYYNTGVTAQYGYLAGRYSWLSSGFSSVSSTIDMIFINKSSAIKEFYYQGVTALPAPPTPLGTVNITFPTNTTYLANNLTISWTVNTTTSLNPNCWRVLDGVETFLGATLNLSTNTSFAELSHGSHTVNITCQDGTANASSVIDFTTLHWLETFSIPTPVLETNATNVNVSIQYVGNVKNVSMNNLTYNGTVYSTTRNIVNSTMQSFNTTLRVPLLDVNNSDIFLNWSYYITYLNLSNTTLQDTAQKSHKALFAYYLETSTATPTTTLELNPVRFNQSVFDELNLSTIAVNVTFNQANYASTFLSDVNKRKNYTVSITMPSVSTNVSNFVWNSTLFVTYNGITKTRNISSATETVYQINLIVCNNTAIRSFNFSFIDEETNSLFSATGLASTADKFEATFDIYSQTPHDLGRNLTFNLSGANTYALCLLNNVTTPFFVNADIRYYNESYSTRFFFLRNHSVSPSVTTFKKLYLLPTAISSPIKFKILSSDGITPASNVVIEALRQYIDNNTYESVAMSLTDTDGNGFMFLKMNTVYHKFKLYVDGVFIREISPLVIGGADITAGATLTYALASGTLSDVFNIVYKVDASCTQTGGTVYCNYADKSGGHLKKIYLTIYKLGVTQFTQVCQNTSTASSGTISCAGSNLNGTYYYWLQGKFESTKFGQNLFSGQFKFGVTAPYGREGLIFAFIIILVLALIGSFNPVATIMLGLAGLIISVGMQFVEVSPAILIGFIAVGGILMYKIRS